MSFFDDEFLLTSFSNFLGISQIGSGKTLAFVLPSFVKLLNRPPPTRSGPCRPSMLILSPIRESALQTKDVISSFDLFRVICLYRGTSCHEQINYIRSNNPTIVVGTPGRVNDLTESNIINLSDVKYLGMYDNTFVWRIIFIIFMHFIYSFG